MSAKRAGVLALICKPSGDTVASTDIGGRQAYRFLFDFLGRNGCVRGWYLVFFLENAVVGAFFEIVMPGSGLPRYIMISRFKRVELCF